MSLNPIIKDALMAEVTAIIKEFRANPRPPICYDCEDDDLYQANLEWRWFRDDLQSQLDDLREQLNLPKITL